MDKARATVGEVLGVLHELAPAESAETWDRVGLQVGDPAAPVDRALVALSVTPGVVREARSQGCQLIVSHHPVIFRPLESLRLDKPQAKLLAELLKHGISVIAVHTNLDKAQDGLNDWLAARLGLVGAAPLPDGRVGSLARVGELGYALTLAQWAEAVRERLALPYVRYIGPAEAAVRRVVTMAGSGGDAVAAAAAAGADVLVTGDVKYHQALQALELGLAVVDAGHFGTEAMVRDELAAYLNEKSASRGWRLTFLPSRAETDPFVLLSSRA